MRVPHVVMLGDKKKDCTRREAMQKVHHAAALFSRRSRAEANGVYYHNLIGRVVQQSYLDAVNTWTRGGGPSLGMEHGVEPLVTTKAATKRAIGLYTDIISKLRKEEADREKAR